MARDSDYLLIDISNSYAKFAFASKKRVSAPARISTSDVTSAVVARFLKKRKVRKVVVSSVVPAKKPSRFGSFQTSKYHVQTSASP